MGSVLLPPPRARAPRRPAREPAFHFRICVGVCPGGREGAGARGAARGRATGEVCSRSPLPGPAALRAAANRAGRGGSLAVASHAPWCADTQARLVPPPHGGGRAATQELSHWVGSGGAGKKLFPPSPLLVFQPSSPYPVAPAPEARRQVRADFGDPRREAYRVRALGFGFPSAFLLSVAGVPTTATSTPVSHQRVAGPLDCLILLVRV